ncbi:MAG: glutathione S-transferase N-terminal domain-containing protein, partial [Paracoccaceae bacterium]
MLLIGQYDSPFVRRVGIALRLYGLRFGHSTWSAFGDAERLRDLNPLTRVPTLVLDDGDVLTDSHIILDYLDFLAPIGTAMLPQTQPDRHRQLAVTALATGLGDKLVSLFYEHRLHDPVSEVWVARCRAQIAAAMARLEADR